MVTFVLLILYHLMRFSKKELMSILLLERNVVHAKVASQIIVSVNSEIINPWESYLRDCLGDSWSRIGMVEPFQSDLKILTNDNLSLINVKITELAIVWSQAIKNRLVP